MPNESILKKLNNPFTWQEFLIDRLDKGFLSKKEYGSLEKFVIQENFNNAALNIIKGGELPLPEKRLLNKLGSTKKRVVYCFPEDFANCLKLLSWLILEKYDSAQPQGCYSFRKGYGAQRALRTLMAVNGIGGMWCYKVDIKDYFNSIDVKLLMPIMKSLMSDDELLICFLERLLLIKEVFQGADNQLVSDEHHGVMAGSATSAFLANIYLCELDEYFTSRCIPYARYSDDIVVFAKEKSDIEEYKNIIQTILAKYHLNVNTDKEKLTAPGEKWEFLGFSYLNGIIDLSDATKEKIKGKIRRKARSLRRWALRKEVSPNQSIKTMIKVFDKKFFSKDNNDEITWSRWFFPVINTDKGLHEIDSYLQQYLRYLSTGSFGKKNYKLSYKSLKDLGYRCLVNEYHSGNN
jgi:hypothetical protein